jgi:hypothetical protein
MKCPKCNVSLSKNSKYCPRCGLLFESNDVKKYSGAFNTDFMEIYFPNKELKFHIDRVSLGYALFTYFYAIYKKMYEIAIKSFIVQFLIYIAYAFGTRYFEDSLGSMFYPILFLIIGVIVFYFHYVFNFDRLLIENRIIKMNKILKNNVDKSNEEIIKIMEEDSKNDVKGLIITILILVLCILLRLVFL